MCLLSPAEIGYRMGLRYAAQARWAEASAAFARGESIAPGDKRFPLELAGVAFKQKKYALAAARLRRALRLDPADPYANEFAATVYFLEGNTEAAIERWNRIGKPRVARLRTPEHCMDPVLLDRAFVFAPSGMITASSYRATLARLRLLNAFSAWALRLEPAEDGSGFDAVLQASNGASWFGALRGLPFQTVTPSVRNLLGRGLNVESLVRWDTQKRRAALAISGPLARDPAWRWRAYADGRNENWEVPRVAGFNLKRIEAGAEVSSVVTGWRWTAGAAFSHRRFWNAPFDGGSTLEARAALDRDLVRLPERRFTAALHTEAALGRFFRNGAYGRTLAGLEARWFPEPRGDDYETKLAVRSGTAQGSIPFDGLYMLGLERDNGLWLRGHIGTSGGRKGSAPIGTSFALLNWELNKIVYTGSFWTLKAAPFFDTGRAFGPRAYGETGWLCDAGLQIKVLLPGGVGFTFVWGRQLRTGRNAFYAF